MWFFMNTCYVMSIVTFILLVVAFFQSFLHFHIYEANHVTFIIFTSIIYIFTETLVIFFYVGTGVSIKEYTQDHKLEPMFHRESIAIKRRVYPPLLMNMLYMMIVFILVGAVDTYRIPQWVYSLMLLACIAHYVKIKIVQNQCFRDNTRNILKMSGINTSL